MFVWIFWQFNRLQKDKLKNFRGFVFMFKNNFRKLNFRWFIKSIVTMILKRTLQIMWRFVLIKLNLKWSLMRPQTRNKFYQWCCCCCCPPSPKLYQFKKKAYLFDINIDLLLPKKNKDKIKSLFVSIPSANWSFLDVNTVDRRWHCFFFLVYCLFCSILPRICTCFLRGGKMNFKKKQNRFITGLRFLNKNN